MKKIDSIMAGVIMGAWMMELILATKCFLEGRIAVGFFVLACALVLILPGLISRLGMLAQSKKPRIDIAEVTKEQAEDIEKMFEHIVKRRLYSEDVIKEIIKGLDDKKSGSDNPDYEKGFEMCKKMCIEYIKDECDLSQ